MTAFPRTFRRFLIRLPDPVAVFGPAEVAAHLLVSDRTARTWLQEWHRADLIRPLRPEAQRIHAWVLAPVVDQILIEERNVGNPP